MIESSILQKMGDRKDITGKLRVTETWFYLLLFFLFSFFYFRLSGYILYFQEQQYMFVFQRDFLREFFSKPGGLLDMAGKFLTQFYFNGLAGSLLLSLILTLPALALFFIIRRINGQRIFTPVIFLIPSLLILLMQSHYYHSMTYNLGYLCVLLYFLPAVTFAGRFKRILFLSTFPLFYYVTGFYAFVFAAMYLVYILFDGKGKEKIIYSFFITAILFQLGFYFFNRPVNC